MKIELNLTELGLRYFQILPWTNSHRGRHFEKMTFKLKSETDIYPGDENGLILQCLVVNVSLEIKCHVKSKYLNATAAF